ncbi:MAG: FGGY-family carbohydrate kinase [Clostridia bacterium]
MEYIITIDVGTSNLRSILYDLNGNSVFSSSTEYHSIFTTPNLVEQEPSTWQNALIVTLKNCCQYIVKNDISVLAIAVTSQRASVIPVDANGQALYNAIMWQDKRSVEQCGELKVHINEHDVYRKTGLKINPYFSLPKMLWLKKHRKDIYQQTYKLIGVQDFVIYHLTKRFITDWTQAARTMLMNINDFRWDEDLLRISGIDDSLLPELCPPGTQVGGLTKEMAGMTGLTEGIPIIIGGGDQQNAAIALNIIKPGYAEANTGTGSFVIAFSQKPAFDEKIRTICSASAIPGKWIVEAGIFNTGSIYRWFKEQFYQNHFDEKEKYKVLDQEVLQTPIGSNGVMILPHFEGSAAPYWNPMAKGLAFNLSLGTKRGDLSRAILEGISMEIADNISLIEKNVEDIHTVSVAGGMTKFALFNQIQANAFDKPVIKYQNSEASSLGAAMGAAVRLGVYNDYEDAFENMGSGEAVNIVPIPEEVSKYKELIRRKNLLYHALNERGIYEIFKTSV